MSSKPLKNILDKISCDLDTQAPVLSTRLKRDPITSTPTTKSTPNPWKAVTGPRYCDVTIPFVVSALQRGGRFVILSFNELFRDFVTHFNAWTSNLSQNFRFVCKHGQFVLFKKNQCLVVDNYWNKSSLFVVLIYINGINQWFIITSDNFCFLC